MEEMWRKAVASWGARMVIAALIRPRRVNAPSVTQLTTFGGATGSEAGSR